MLVVPVDKYFAAYNDYDFIFHTKKQQGFDYLSVHKFYVGFKEHFPTYGIQYELNEDGSNLFYIKSTINDENKLIQQKQETIEALNNVPESKDSWKIKKKLETKLDEINNEIVYGYRGVIIKPYVVDLEIGSRTPSMDFPIMLTNNNSVMNPDSRDVTDAIARGDVKVGGRFTGYGYRLFTREGIGDDLETAQLVKVIKAIVDRSEQLGIEIDKSIVNFGTNFNVLKQLAINLKQKLDS